MRILFFIGTLASGGKERRLIELLSYLKDKEKYTLQLVLRKEIIDFPKFYNLNISHIVLSKKYIKGDLSLQYKFYKLCRTYKPDVIHAWGSMPAFVSIFAKTILKIPLINSQITDAFLNKNPFTLQNIINRINFRFSDEIISNSLAGLKAYNPKCSSCRVIYNGINIDRFLNLSPPETVKTEYKIFTPYVVIMVATFSDLKDYDTFVNIAKEIYKQRHDVTFIAIGDGPNFNNIKYRVQQENVTNIIFTGKINNVESVVSIADIGVLFSPKGEGISNAILEYMALGKPVIANNLGGNNEIIKQDLNGILLNNETIPEIAHLIIELLDNNHKRELMGQESKEIIKLRFNLNRMGRDFEEVYLKYFKKNL